MVVLYWLIVMPVGLVRRLFGIQDIDFRWRDGTLTYWHQRQSKLAAKRRYNSQF